MTSLDSQLCSNHYVRKNLICWFGDFNKNFGVPSFVWNQNFTESYIHRKFHDELCFGQTYEVAKLKCETHTSQIHL